MDILIIVLILLAVVLALVGIVGAIVPALPGPPLCFGALLIDYFVFEGSVITMPLVVTMLVLTIAVQVLDYVAPIWLTKLGGGSKKAMWGSTLGIVVGLFFMPLGLVVGPLLGAFVGEMMTSNDCGKALKVSLMSLIAFLLTTGVKLIICLVMTYYCFAAMFDKVF